VCLCDSFVICMCVCVCVCVCVFARTRVPMCRERCFDLSLICIPDVDHLIGSARGKHAPAITPSQCIHFMAANGQSLVLGVQGNALEVVMA
jgi:hypothetical protein